MRLTAANFGADNRFGSPQGYASLPILVLFKVRFSASIVPAIATENPLTTNGFCK